MMKTLRSLVWRYGFAIVAFALPLLLSFWLRQWHLGFDPTWFLIAALILVAWFIGRGPGLLFAVLLALALSYFSPPARHLKFDTASFNRLALFAALALMTSARHSAEEKLKIRARQQAAVAQFGQQALVGSALAPLSSLVDEATSLAARHLGVEYAGVWELLPDGETLRLQTGIGWEENSVSPALLGGEISSPAGYLLPSDEPIIITDLRRETRFAVPPMLRDRQVVSGVSVLVSGTERPLGVLSVHTTTRRKFTSDDLNFLRALANILAEVIERQKREKALQEGREWLRVTLASIGDAVIATNIQGHVTFMNAVASSLTGWQQAEAEGKPLEDILRTLNEETREPADNPVAQVIRQGEIVGLANHTVLIARDGTEKAIDDSGAPIRDASGQIIGAVMVFRDVTERRRQERGRAELLELERRAHADADVASRLKDEFLSTVSHELRTPLNAILGWARLLSYGKLNADAAERALASILRNAKTQGQIIEDLLDVSRIVAGKLRLNVSPVELHSVIESAITTVRPAAEAKGIQLRTQLPPEPITVTGDSDRLLQVIWNLLSNAIKFTAPDGEVEVRLMYHQGQAKIEVEDTGQGINPDFLPYVFDRFRQADSTSTRMFGGLGLGLAIVRNLVESHGGTVHAESPGAGQGATFAVLLPLAQPTVEGVKEVTDLALLNREMMPGPQSDALEGVEILVVDDELETLDLLTAILSQHGARVTAVASASAALKSLEQYRPDVLISDIGMPGEDGYELIGKIRAWTPEAGGQIPAIALTAYARVEDRQRALTTGYQMHAPKPIEPAELVKSIAILLGRMTPRRPNAQA